ncbi:hypothetical protein LXL04_010127 [Taraxacum kok-saghyz]
MAGRKENQILIFYCYGWYKPQSCGMFDIDLAIWYTTRITRHKYDTSFPCSCLANSCIRLQNGYCLFVFIRINSCRSVSCSCLIPQTRIKFVSCLCLPNLCRVNSCLTRIHDTVTRIARSSIDLSQSRE